MGHFFGEKMRQQGKILTVWAEGSGQVNVPTPRYIVTNYIQLMGDD